MADQGPLVRVDTNGRGYLIKMGRKAADEYVATHPGSVIVGARPEPAEPESPFVEQAAQAPDLARMKKADLVKLAKERGVDPSGTADDLRERLGEPDSEAGSEEETDQDEESESESDEDDSEQE